RFLYNSLYYLKKSFALYPGHTEPVSAKFLADHYRTLRAGRSAARAGIDWLVAAAFHAWVPFRARSVARKFGLDDDWARRATAIARARFADPNDLALFRIQAPEELDDWMRRFESAPINKL